MPKIGWYDGFPYTSLVTAIFGRFYDKLSLPIQGMDALFLGLHVHMSLCMVLGGWAMKNSQLLCGKFLGLKIFKKGSSACCKWERGRGECAGTKVLLESSIVAVELALQVYCNLMLKIIHCAGSGGVGLFYRKVFPHGKIFVLCVSFSIYFLYAWLAAIFLFTWFKICKCKRF